MVNAKAHKEIDNFEKNQARETALDFVLRNNWVQYTKSNTLVNVTPTDIIRAAKVFEQYLLTGK